MATQPQPQPPPDATIRRLSAAGCNAAEQYPYTRHQPQPPPDATIRRLSAAGCNAAELSAYTGHEPQDAIELAVGPEWWRQLRRVPETGE